MEKERNQTNLINYRVVYQRKKGNIYSPYNKIIKNIANS